MLNKKKVFTAWITALIFVGISVIPLLFSAHQFTCEHHAKHKDSECEICIVIQACEQIAKRAIDAPVQFYAFLQSFILIGASIYYITYIKVKTPVFLKDRIDS